MGSKDTNPTSPLRLPGPYAPSCECVHIQALPDSEEPQLRPAQQCTPETRVQAAFIRAGVCEHTEENKCMWPWLQAPRTGDPLCPVFDWKSSCCLVFWGDKRLLCGTHPLPHVLTLHLAWACTVPATQRPAEAVSTLAVMAGRCPSTCNPGAFRAAWNFASSTISVEMIAPLLPWPKCAYG